MRKYLYAAAATLAVWSPPAAAQGYECVIERLGDATVVVRHPAGFEYWFSGPVWYTYNPLRPALERIGTMPLGICSNHADVAAAIGDMMQDYNQCSGRGRISLYE